MEDINEDGWQEAACVPVSCGAPIVRVAYMLGKYRKYKLVWLGIKVEIRYAEPWMRHSGLPNSQVNHLEVRADCPLPMTSTGYKSHFTYEPIKDPVEFVRQELEKEKKGVWLMLERSLGV